MKTLVQRLDLVIAFALFLLCCIISFVESNTDAIQEATVTIAPIVGG